MTAATIFFRTASGVSFPISRQVHNSDGIDQYDVPRGTKAHPKNKLGIFQSLQEHYNQADLDAFYAAHAPFVAWAQLLW